MSDLDPFDDDGEDAQDPQEQDDPVDPDEGDPLILIVVGAHLRAEVGDRPLAYRLQSRVVDWLRERFSGGSTRPTSPTAEAGEAVEAGEAIDVGLPFEVVVCTDVLYLNDAGLRVWPTISVGGPGVNALSAYLADKLPSVFVIDDVLMIQMQPELEEVTAAIWGIDHQATVSALDAFLERYLHTFMTAATRSLA